ncbi:MAG: hypothetical protein QOI40_3418 [Alphaproteobacteria bacterium]|jgi:hypothetical protein|nr:hypothetical protein [Alphaproteobacteria bacterium]
MKRLLNHSDTVLIRSDEHEELFVRGSTQTPPSTDADLATNRAGHTRVTYRDLQALWSPQLSLHGRARARAQAILVNGRPNWRTPAPRLCAERDLPPNRCVSRQLPQTAGDAQRDLRDQCRASASPRESRLNGSGCRNARFCQGGRHHRQHDRILSCRRRPAVQCGRSRSC